MIIGVDTRALTRGTRTGVEEYVINLLSRLLKLDRNIEYRLFLSAWRKVLPPAEWLKLSNVKLYDYKIPSRLLFGATRYLGRPKIDKLLGGINVFFNPHFFNAPLSKNCQKVMTFHDLSFAWHPEYFSLRKRIWHRFLMSVKQEAKSADKIIAVSESTKQDLIDLYKLPEDKIRVIYSGVGEEFMKNESRSMNHESWAKIKKNYKLPEKFILYFGTIEPRKNITGLIRAFEILKGKNRNFGDLNLVIAGGRGWLYNDIFKKAATSKFNEQIIFTGFVEPEDKVYLYNLASLFVYPSFFEGFGFPPLEAMACGVPVITSNTSSLPEVTGDAGLMIDPYDIDELAWAMEEVLTDKNLSEELSRRGLERAKMFSWDKCASETLKLLIFNS